MCDGKALKERFKLVASKEWKLCILLSNDVYVFYLNFWLTVVAGFDFRLDDKSQDMIMPSCFLTGILICEILCLMLDQLYNHF